MVITSNPLPTPIEKSSLSIGFQEIARIPDSGTGNSAAPRLNYLTNAGDSSGRLFANDMRGKLYVIDNGNVSEYLDLKSVVGDKFLARTGQQGFISFVFDPDFKNNGIFYTVNSEKKEGSIPDFPVTKPIYDNKGNLIQSSHHDVIRKWLASDPKANVFSGTQKEILRIEQPYSDHNVGQIAFNPNAKPGDPDRGMLYMAVADGGSNGFPVSGTDPLHNGQDLNTPLAKILRIDPRGNNSANGKYGIPVDNPFVNDGDPKTLGEIWAYGLRNPHRISWDTGGDGKMLIDDIGQFFIEEINLGIKGANYGWGNREGTFVTAQNNEHVLYELPPDDSKFGYTYPVAQYDHDITGLVAIAGGYVYRGAAIPELVGQYIAADFANDGRFFNVSSPQLVNGQQATLSELRLFNGTTETSFLDIVQSDRSDVRFGVDEAGEIYVTNKKDGIVRKIVRSPKIAAPNSSPAFYISDVTILEGTSSNLSALFNVNLTRPASNNVKVNYATADGLALAGQDYTPISGTLTFLPGEISKTINVSIIDDNLSERDEFFTVKLSNPENAGLVQPVGTATITDTIFSSVNYTLAAGVENLTLTGMNNIRGTGNTSDNLLIGNNGNNVLNGQVGADTMVGGLGNDYYYVDNGTDRVIENLNEGNDTVKAIISYTLPNNVENVILSGTGNFKGSGNSLNNRIIGNDANNNLFGDNGNDFLSGKNGRDTLTGGNGNDVFLFNSKTEGSDLITDFSVSNDTIQIKASGFGGGLTAGRLKSERFVLGSASRDSNDRFLYRQRGGGLFFDVDGKGGISPVQVATLSNHPFLSFNNILIV
ncbi:MAG: hypothetical protein N5P05_000260 [Chroococcopsis gigantea SAG 12.99]|jgi:Ca2+-binding RTX toxin-like protein|nr:hypothetical protein [Chroococcopsis gigantea SAG 12.99]